LAIEGRNGGGVDDDAALTVLARRFFCDGGGGKADHVEGADEVDADGLRKRVQAVRAFAADDFFGGGDSGAIDERVQVAKGAEGEIDGGLRVGFAGNVGEGEAGGCAQIGGQGLARWTVGVGDDDGCAFTDEQVRRGCAQSRCAAGDKKDVIRNLHGKSGIFHVPSAAYHCKCIRDHKERMFGGKKP